MASKQREELCNECDEYATWYCVQDEANFCDQHNTAVHSLKSLKSHKVVCIGDKAAIIKSEAAKPMNCKSHHMPLCLYCLFCKNVCCVACVTVDIHKEHADQVKSVVDVANGEKKILQEHLDRVENLRTVFINEQTQLQQLLENLHVNEAKCSQEIDKEFDRIINCVQARREALKKQLQEKAKTRRDNISSRQEDVKNISFSLNRCLEEGEHVLTLNDFAALSQSKTIIEKMGKLETENVEYHQQTQLIDSIPFNILSQKLLEMINDLGTVAVPPPPSFDQEKCKVANTSLDIAWEPIKYEPPITTYVVELGQSNHNFSEVYRGLETKHHLQDLTQNTSYILRLYAGSEKVVGSTAVLEMKTLDLDLNNWTISMSSSYYEPSQPQWTGENTRESLLDGQFTTGAATKNSSAQWIQVTFPHPVPVTSVTIAPLLKSGWTPSHGNGGTLQYSHDNISWTDVGTIAYVDMQRQTFSIGIITARYWRLFTNSYACASSFVFK